MNGFLRKILPRIMICDAGDIVVVPFPFTDRKSTKRRPALVLSSHAFNRSHEHTILAMITTAIRTRWKSDCNISKLKPTELPAPSVVRMKIFTLDNRLIVRKIGTLHEVDRRKVHVKLAKEVLNME